MSRTLRVLHRTGYRYERPATASYNEARMTPLTSPEQQVLHSRIDVKPRAWQHTWTDYWGTSVTAFEVHERHEKMEVAATSTVHINRAGRLAGGAGWDVVDTPEVADRWAELLATDGYVDTGEELGELTRRWRTDSKGPDEFVTTAVEAIRQRVRYLKGVTGVHSQAQEAWAAGAGVCQDLSHLTIGVLREAGIPARYVSGYLADLPDTEESVGVSAPGESHSWVQYWVGEWRGIDPTNLLPIGDQHIEVGYGRDYADVAPLRGVFTGGASHDMAVEVHITPLR